jgi:lipoprotein signal peptidase
MIFNTGVSFGIEMPMVVIVVMILGLIYWFVKERSWGLFLMIVGGLSNLGERLIYGGVRDYWKIPYTTLYNNLADWLIFVGLVLYIWQKIIKKSK